MNPRIKRLMAQQITFAKQIRKLESKLQQSKVARRQTEHRYRELYHWEKQTREMVQSLRQSLVPEDLYPQLVIQLGEMLQLDRCFVIHFQDSQSGPIEFEYLKDPSISSILGVMPPYEAPFLYQKMGNGYRQSLFIEDIASLCAKSALNPKAYSFRGFVRLPIIYQEHLLANLILQTVHPRLWSEREVYLLSTLSEQLAVTLYQSRLLKELEKTTQLKSMFLANMSHELRTPLNAIIGYSEMMANGMAGALSEKQTRYIQNVAASGRHLLTLVNDILDLSKVESGKISLDLKLFEFPVLIHEVANILKTLADKKQVQFELELDSQILFALADPARFKQILYNLLSNAIKFTESGGQVRLQASQAEDEKTLLIQVSDTGIGIAQADWDKVFCEFVQIDNSYARRQEGTGLGLALTRKLVELHGGCIAFESEAGVGSTFTVQIPCLVKKTSLEQLPFLLHC